MKKVILLKNGVKINLRHITKSDIEGVWKNFNEVVDEEIYIPIFTPVKSEYEKKSWYKNLVKEKEICIVAEHPKLKSPYNIIGQCEITNSEWEGATHVGILGVIIRNSYRNLGLGKNLIDVAIKESKNINNKEKIILSCFSSNEIALNLYQSIGFRVVGTRKKQFYMNSTYIDEVLMELWIDDYVNE